MKLLVLKATWSPTAVREIAKRKDVLFLLVGGLTFLLCYLSLPNHWSFQGGDLDGVRDPHYCSWKKWSTRAEEWRSNREIQKHDPNWAGRQRMYEHRVNGSLWWDEKAAQYFITKLESNQFPSNCSRAHWIAHYDWMAGLFSTVHVFLLPLMFSMVRGHTLLPISLPHQQTFDGCSTEMRARNLQCFFNVTSCNFEDDAERRGTVLSSNDEKFRTSWEELLMEGEDFFTPGGVTVVKSIRRTDWMTPICVGSSFFSSFDEAYNYHKFKVWDKMRESGQVGVVKGYDSSSNVTGRTCSGYSLDSQKRRLDMVLTALMSSWMLNQVSEHVKGIAETIMSRYSDASGRPLWTPPVLGIHIRRTDKWLEDPYHQAHGRFRPLEDYTSQMYRMEEEYGFQWPSIFIISDSGTAIETVITFINGEAAAPTNMTRKETGEGEQKNAKRFIMRDWSGDDHLQEKYGEHAKVPAAMKYDMQSRFLATIYIMTKIADHAIVTYSSNVGRFIGEAMTANHRVAFPDSRGPLVTSLDYPWSIPP